MTGERQLGQIRCEVRSLLLPGIELELAEAQTVDMGKHHVQTSIRLLPYDYLVVLWAQVAPEMIPGLSAQTFYTFDRSLKLHDALKRFRREVAVVTHCL
jgi:NADH dehydrogenase FAD-containing subunit